MVAERIASELQIVVGCANSRGILPQGSTTWINWSKFSADVTVPERGAVVIAQLDKAGFIRSLAVEPSNSAAATEIAPAMPNCSGPADRETRITRMACLNTATAILSRNGPVVLGDVIETAAVLEMWVSR